MRPASRPDHFKEDKTMALLYNLPGHDQKAWQREGAAINAAGAMRPGQTTTTTGPGKTVGGAIMGGAGGATLASTLGASMTGAGLAGPAGLALGAAIGIGSYLLS